MVDTLGRWVRAGIWTLPVYGLLTLLATLTHQPDPTTQFESWSRYVTTRVFLLSHIFGSITGAAFGILGMAALAAFLAGTHRSGLAAAGLVAGVLGHVLITAVFGIAAGAQPALGRPSWRESRLLRRCTARYTELPSWGSRAREFCFSPRHLFFWDGRQRRPGAYQLGRESALP